MGKHAWEEKELLTSHNLQMALLGSQLSCPQCYSPLSRPARCPSQNLHLIAAPHSPATWPLEMLGKKVPRLLLWVGPVGRPPFPSIGSLLGEMPIGTLDCVVRPGLGRPLLGGYCLT